MTQNTKTSQNTYRQTLVDRDGFVLAAFTIFSLLLLGLSIYASNGISTAYPIAADQSDPPVVFGP